MPPVEELPEDTKVLKQFISELYKQIEKRDDQVEQLRHQVQMLIRARYGSKAEKVSLGQLTLFEKGEQDQSAEDEQSLSNDEEPAVVARKSSGRKKPSKELPRKKIVYELTEEQLACPGCGDTRHRIGQETSEQYDCIPASVWVLEHVRCTYACSQCEKAHVITAPGPQKPIAKGLAAEGMLSYVAVGKLADHLPLHRLEGIFKRQGVRIPRSTMCDWMAATASILEPLYDRMKQRVLQSRIVWTDDTPVKLQDRDDDRNIREARVWVYIGDVDNKFTVYDFTDSRKRDGPKNFLSNFKGYLQADAFAGYDCIYAAGDVEEVACMAHARRKFFECLGSSETSANQALSMIRELYAIERRIAQMSFEEKRQIRIAESAPKLHKFKKWLNQERLVSLPKSPMGKAVTYALNNWRALCRYVKDGELSIDNNCSERAMRGVAIGRKNWLFAGSKEGGRTAAIISSFIATCKELNLNPQQYIADVLRRLSAGETEFDRLLPGAWTPTHL